MAENEFYADIEEPIRELVRRLRDRGINTICSCGHEMYVQSDLIPEAKLQVMHRTVYEYLVEKDAKLDYTIDIHLVVKRGIISQCFAEIRIGGA